MTHLVSRLHRPFFRNGENHRSGADVSFADINTLFGFRTVTVGKWVNKQEQQIAANLIFDALCDLMTILHIPKQVISFNGSLSLAFGAGGQKHSSAHYDSRTRQLALAKNAGGGALAHEWFHAFDHYICAKTFPSPGDYSFASEAWLNDQQAIEHQLTERLFSCFESVFLCDDGTQANEFVTRSVQVDQHLGCYYFAKPQELAARAFEASIQSHSIKNAFLVQGTKQSGEAKLGIYPNSLQSNKIQQHFLDYFNVLGQAVAHKS